MIAPLQNFILKASALIQQHWVLRALCYALMTAAIYAVWLLTDGDSVAFVYSEF